MDVYQIPISRLPREFAEIRRLARLSWAGSTVIRGDFAADLAAGPPAHDRPIEVPCNLVKLYPAHDAVRAVLPEGQGWAVRNCTYMPAGGGLSWHTNSNSPGWRVYVPAPTGRSGVRTLNGDVLDRDGYANVFEVGPGAWHAVWADAPRTCFGVQLPEDVIRTLLS